MKLYRNTKTLIVYAANDPYEVCAATIPYWYDLSEGKKESHLEQIEEVRLDSELEEK
jgi:hypothetical protein